MQYENAHRSAPQQSGEPSFDRAGQGDTQAEREREPDRDSGWRSPPARRFRKGLAYARPLRPRLNFAPVSGHEERQRRLALAAQDVEVDGDPGARGEPPRRLSPVAHGNDALATWRWGARNL